MAEAREMHDLAVAINQSMGRGWRIGSGRARRVDISAGELAAMFMPEGKNARNNQKV